MNDNEIKKALECCGDEEEMHWCTECPYYDKENDFCQEDLHRDVLDLITRQKAEIERLEIELKAMRGAANSYKLEVERLTAIVEAAEDYLNPLPFKNAYDEAIETAKSEATKEFAERAKEVIVYDTIRRYSDANGISYDLEDMVSEDIDNLVKELTEESDNA